MTTRYFNALIFCVSLVAAILLTLVEPRYPTMGMLLWPGTGITLVIFVLAHGDWFRHPLLITCLDILFNALLYTAMIAMVRKIGQLFGKHLRRM